MHNFIKVEYETIKQNDYNLVFNRYVQPTINNSGKSTAKWEMVKLGDVLTYEQPTNYIVTNTNYDNISNKNNIPVLTAGKSFVLGYTEEKIGIFSKNLPVIIFDDFTTSSKYIDFSFKVKSSAMKILTNRNNNNLKYIYYIMQTIKFEHSTHKRYWISEYSNCYIPLPPIETQQKIVEELESIENRIKQIEDMIKQEQEKFDCILNELFYA